jgi:hypothetical protein
MKLTDLGVEYHAASMPIALIPLHAAPLVIQGLSTRVSFRDAVDFLTQHSGTAVPVDFFSFTALSRHFFSPGNPDLTAALTDMMLQSDDVPDEMKAAIADADSIQFRMNENISEIELLEREEGYDPGEEVDEEDGGSGAHDGEEDDDENDGQVEGVVDVEENLSELERLEQEEGDDPESIYVDAMTGDELARWILDPVLLTQLEELDIQPSMLLAALYAHTDTNERVQLGFLVSSETEKIEAANELTDLEEDRMLKYYGSLLLFPGAFHALFEHVSGGDRSNNALLVHQSQVFAAELLSFLNRMGISTTMRGETGKLVIALELATPRTDQTDSVVQLPPSLIGLKRGDRSN